LEKLAGFMPQKIVYLFGAGATHAEIQNIDPTNGNFLAQKGLLIKDVSKRIMQIAQEDIKFIKGVEQVTYREGPVNIELLISLFETNRIPDSAGKVAHLKDLVKKDITKVLTSKRRKNLYLHKALFELHKLILSKERILGIISLNYDEVLDDAYKATNNNKTPIYCHTSNVSIGKNDFPLLKLHGSFNWKSIETYGKKKNFEIIPLGVNKNYLSPPYNFIWGKAFEVLAQCDILRIVGCSLNQNDLGLIDLLFKAHLERNNYFEIQIIDSPSTGRNIKSSYGFFKGIVPIEEVERPLIPLDDINMQTANPFKIWLKAKAEKMVSTKISRTKYLKRLREA
jgi:hypothetical protein